MLFEKFRKRRWKAKYGYWKGRFDSLVLNKQDALNKFIFSSDVKEYLDEMKNALANMNKYSELLEEENYEKQIKEIINGK